MRYYNLTDAEVAILAAGYSPLFVRPQSLVAYWPLASRQSPEIDLMLMTTLKCGCKIVRVELPDLEIHQPQIIYCPKHAAADAMYEVCQGLSEHLNSDVEFPRYTLHKLIIKARAALALAEGDDDA